MYLIINNQEWVARLTKWRLQQSVGPDINVVLAEDGLEAIQRFEDIVSRGQHSLVKIVMIDYHLPIVTGIDTLKFIRNIERRNRLTTRVKIIGTTTDATDDVVKEFVDAGANTVLENPIPEGELEAICAQDLT
jgi:CheY-like chemotaxis protein